MRIPKTPPEFSHLIQDLIENPEVFQKGISSAAYTPLANGKYLHWDELIRQPSFEGLTHEQWWTFMKSSRKALFRPLPLLDKKEKPFQYIAEIPFITEQLHRTDLGAGGRIEMPQQILNPNTRDRYYVNSLIEEAVTSSQLEGATTTRKVAADMIRSGRGPRDKSERMIYNNYLTMRHIAEIKQRNLSMEMVLEIHSFVTDRTLDDPGEGGRLRGPHEAVNVTNNDRDEVVHVPPPADQLEARMKAMCDFANGKTPSQFLHPVLRSIILHFWLAYDHPFVDGNGRTARALFYWSMLHHGYWLFEFVSISRILRNAPAKYGRAFLYTETDDNDLTYFLIFNLKVILRAIVELHEYIEIKTRQTQLLERQLRGMSSLNHRQQALISHALRHPGHRYTIESHRMSHNIVYETGRTDLMTLVSRGLLKVNKVNRTQFFIPVPELESKLRQLENF
ncbi:MAG: Fic family protein [Candidatus Hydrogenedentes bacterium]|nr:Fic family protein [Candidatus Hydrogenedentota bacterium]